MIKQKIDAIIKIVEKEKAKNHCKQRSSSNMSVASSNSSEPQSNPKAKSNQYHPYIVYPPKAKKSCRSTMGVKTKVLPD